MMLHELWMVKTYLSVLRTQAVKKPHINGILFEKWCSLVKEPDWMCMNLGADPWFYLRTKNIEFVAFFDSTRA